MGGLLGCVAYQWGKVPSTHICHSFSRDLSRIGTHTHVAQCSGFQLECFYPLKDSGQCPETFFFFSTSWRELVLLASQEGEAESTGKPPAM